MILAIQRYFAAIPPVFTDGLIFVCIQALTFLTAAFGTDEAAKYIAPATLFWLKIALGECASVALAIKMFRSTSYGEYKNGNGKTNGNGH